MSEGGQGEGEGGQDFAVTRYVPEGQPLFDEDLPIFLVQVKSDTAIGAEMLRDPIGVLRERVPELSSRLSEPDVRAMVLRVNAEVPANPRHRSDVWILYPGSTTAVGIQYKYDR